MRVDAVDEAALFDAFRQRAEAVGAIVRGESDAGEPVAKGSAADDSLVAVIHARLAIAETGSVLFVHDDPAEVTALALARRLIVLLDRSSIVASLPDAVPVLEELGRRHTTWTLLTGPSRTADIERQLTIGVHGSVDFEIVVTP